MVCILCMVVFMQRSNVRKTVSETKCYQLTTTERQVYLLTLTTTKNYYCVCLAKIRSKGGASHLIIKVE